MNKKDYEINSEIILSDKKYLVKDKVLLDRVKYYLLINIENTNEILVRKTNDLLLLNDEQEFDIIYRIFRQRNAF